MSSLFFFPLAVLLKFMNFIDLFKELASYFIDFLLLFCFQFHWLLALYLLFLSFCSFWFFSFLFVCFFRWEFRLLIWDLSCVQMNEFKFSSQHCDSCVPQLFICCISFLYSSIYFCISLEMSFLIHGLFRSMLFRF